MLWGHSQLRAPAQGSRLAEGISHTPVDTRAGGPEEATFRAVDLLPPPQATSTLRCHQGEKTVKEDRPLKESSERSLSFALIEYSQDFLKLKVT